MAGEKILISVAVLLVDSSTTHGFNLGFLWAVTGDCWHKRPREIMMWKEHRRSKGTGEQIHKFARKIQEELGQ